MGTTAAPRIEPSNSKLIAPWLHTGLLVALFLGLGVGGAYFQRHARSEPGMLQQHPRVVPLYVSLMAMEWGLFVWVWRGGLRKTGTKLRELNWRKVGKRERRPRGLWPRDRFMGCLDSGRAGVESRVGWAMLLQSRLSYYN